MGMMSPLPNYDSVLPILALVLLIAVPVAAEDAVGLSWTIYHSWRPNQDFVRRGTLSWYPEKKDIGNTSSIQKKSSSVFQIINDDQSANLTANDIKDMLDYGWYHVKIQGDTWDDTNANFVFQTVPACNLRRANFKDQFDITLPRSSLGDRQDPITSFAYTPLVSPLAPKSCDYETNDDEKVKTFSSKVNVQLDTPAMTLKNILSQSKPPPGLALMKQPQQQGGGGEKAATAAEARITTILTLHRIRFLVRSPFYKNIGTLFYLCSFYNSFSHQQRRRRRDRNSKNVMKIKPPIMLQLLR